MLRKHFLLEYSSYLYAARWSGCWTNGERCEQLWHVIIVNTGPKVQTVQGLSTNLVNFLVNISSMSRNAREDPERGDNGM